MPLKLAYLGVWHSHAVMHVREAEQRPDEFQIIGMYEPEEAVRQQKWQQWTKHISDFQVYANIEEVLFSETTTFGVRRYRVLRHKLVRRPHTVSTPWGPVDGKLGWRGSGPVTFAPEYESCRRMAQNHHVPMREVFHAARAAFSETGTDVRDLDA